MLRWGGLLATGFGLCLATCGGDLRLVVEAPTFAVPADGQKAAVITVKVLYGKSTVERGRVNFKVDIGKFQPITQSQPDTTGATVDAELTGGAATASLYSNVAGTSRVTIIWTDSQSTANRATGTAEVSFDTPKGGDGGLPPNYNNFTFSCESRVIQGMDTVGLPLKCFAIVADRSSRKIAGAKVTFITEAGAIDGTKFTTDQGEAVTTLTTGNPMPLDVSPDSVAYREMQGPGRLFPWSVVKGEPSYVVGTTTYNPRDGIVTIVAATEGEEAWVDTNSNGRWDPSVGSDPQEPFSDLPEPFIDKNDNLVRDSNEEFIDVNGNQAWDRPNGKWDSKTTIWQQFLVIWTAGIWAANPNGSHITSVRPANGTAPTLDSVPHCIADGTRYFVRFVDLYLNFVAAASRGDNFRVSTTTGGAIIDCAQCASFASGPPVGDEYYDFVIKDPHLNSTPCPTQTNTQPTTIKVEYTHTSAVQGGTTTTDFLNLTGVIP